MLAWATMVNRWPSRTSKLACLTTWHKRKYEKSPAVTLRFLTSPSMLLVVAFVASIVMDSFPIMGSIERSHTSFCITMIWQLESSMHSTLKLSLMTKLIDHKVSRHLAVYGVTSNSWRKASATRVS